MKKIAVLLLLVLALAGCGKKESGIFTVQNDSSYPVTFSIGQDYKTEKYTLESGKTKDVAWKQYVLFHSVSPSSIITWQERSNKVVITNNTPAYKYQVRNSVTPITMLDNNQNILSKNDEKADSLPIPEGESEIECFKPMAQQSIILDKGTPFTIGTKQYTPIEKIESSYYFNENDGGKIKTSKINIVIENNLIIIYK